MDIRRWDFKGWSWPWRAARYRQQRDDEAWKHAACLSVAEGVYGWEKCVESSPAIAAVKSLRRRYEEAVRVNDDLARQVEGMYSRTPVIVSEAGRQRKDLERLMTLAGVEEGNTLWQVVLSYADEHERTEREVALKPDMGDGQRQYNAGRAASAYDFAMGLRDLRVEALRARARNNA